MNNYITGSAIRTLREKNHLTQQQLAEKLCVSDKAISKWETGKGFIACKGVCPYFCFWGCKMDRAFMDEYYDKMRADDIEELSSQRNEDYSDRADDYKAAKQALLEGLGLSHLFSGNRKLTPEEKELWLLFDRVYVTELLARDEFAKGAYMLGAEDRETMLR